ncbi:MAG: FKBP-type peptidyl-prolyl cis-trans isomerase [Deltaproteobacteria bacterium]|nr:FKBP-type peptidyl-prolyl cis-trans isomerase [Deltaproteobacteria bacterium]
MRALRHVLLALGATVALSHAVSSCTPPPAAPAESPAATKAAQLEKIDLVVGTGAEAHKGSAVSVHYVGQLQDGTVFDSSRARDQPFTFIIGQGKVIRGWEQGVPGMRVGGKRKLIVPPQLGYGEDGQPPKIPGNATLVFEIELLHVVD